jgi:hypothetical protein
MKLLLSSVPRMEVIVVLSAEKDPGSEDKVTWSSGSMLQSVPEVPSSH